MDVFFTIQVESDRKKNFISLPLLVYASDEDEAMNMSQSVVQCLGLLSDKTQAKHHDETREELDILNNDIYFLTTDDIKHVTDFLSIHAERFKTELEEKKSTGLSAIVSEANFSDDVVRYLHVVMATHRAIRHIDRELSDA